MSSKATTDQREILDWASQHDFHPVEVVAAEHDSEPPKLAFAAQSEIRGQLRLLAWDQFFAFFHLQELALIYDAGSDDEPGSDFYEIVHNQLKKTGDYAPTVA